MATRQAEWPARDDDAVHPRHQARRGRPRPDHRAGRGCPSVWAAALDHAARRLAPVPDPAFGEPALAGRRRRLADPAGERACTPTPRRRCARPATAPRGPTPDAAYEAAVHAAVDAAFDDDRVRAVLARLLDARVAEAGWSNALAAKLVALTMPGVPDVYQGSELWEQSLVDPDNRRPVDFDHRGRGARGRGRPRCAEAARSPRAALTAAPRPARAVHDVHARDGDGAGRRARARVRPRRRDHRRHPAAARPGRRAAAGATPPSPCRPAPGATCSPTGVGRQRSPTCSPASRWPCLVRAA